jgi:DNA-binding NarL/FixJ family response regulator
MSDRPQAARRLVVVEDDAPLRADLVALLGASPTLEVVGEAGTARAALALARRLERLDVALVDLRLPDASGADLVAGLVAAHPAVAVVVLTLVEDPDTVIDVLRAGARGYLLKSTPPHRLVAALGEAADGGSPMTSSVARVLVDRVARPAPAEALPALSQRERDVLALLARGHTYASVAGALGVGVGTVQSYVKAIYGKLGVASKAEAALHATRMGLVE